LEDIRVFCCQQCFGNLPEEFPPQVKQRETFAQMVRVRACCVGTTCFLFVLAILLPIGFANDWWYLGRLIIFDSNKNKAG